MKPNTSIKARLFAGLAFGLFLCGACAGQASAASVETVTFGGNGANGPCSAGYNFVGFGANFSSIYGSCPVNVTGTTATGDQIYFQGTQETQNVFSGTVDPVGQPLGSATASFDRSSVVISDPTTGYLATGSGYAAANLADGTIHASATGNTIGEDFANALETDNLHFVVAGATDLTVTDITAQFTLDGGFTVGNPSGNQASMLWETGLGTSGLAISYEGLNGVVQLDNLLTSGNVIIIKNTPGEIVYDATYEIDGASANVPITQNIFLGAGSGWTVDYANTGTISLILPSNVSFTSDSGVFLTAPAGVPEPATWAMMMAGFGGMGLALRRSRRPRAA